MGASTKEEDNIRLPFSDCILDFSKTGTSQPVIACMLDTGSQISVCSYSMFIKLGGDPSSLDKSTSFSISSTTELRDDCILGVVKVDLYIMLKLKSGQPEFGKTFVNMLVGKEQLDLENKVILGVDVLHRAKIMIHSNGHHFALVGRLERENGQIAKVRLQPHLWQKDLEIKHGAALRFCSHVQLQLKIRI